MKRKELENLWGQNQKQNTQPPHSEKLAPINEPEKSGKKGVSLMAMPLVLVEPSLDFERSCIQMLRGYQKNGEKRYSSFFDSQGPDVQKFVAHSARLSTVQQGNNQVSTFWLVDHEKNILGVVRIRHQLNEVTEKVGGHIGYDVPHAFRGKGHGTLLLNLALVKAKEIGLERVLITCNEDNIASVKIIEKNGGEYEGNIYLEELGITKRRYWIDLKSNL